MPETRTAFFFRVIQHVFINTIQQITRQGNVEFVSLAQVLGDINVHHGPRAAGVLRGFSKGYRVCEDCARTARNASANTLFLAVGVSTSN